MAIIKGLMLVLLELLLLGRGFAAQAPGAGSGTPPLSPSLQEAFNQGVAALQAGQLDSAEKAFRQVLQGGGRLPFVYNDLGIVHEQRGQREQAIGDFREAIRLDPAYVAPRVLLGSTLLAMNRPGEAARELEAAVKLDPGDPLAHLQLAKALKQEEDYPRVVEQYQALRKLAPQDAEYTYQSTRAYLDLSAWCFREITRLQPNSARAYQALGNNFLDEGKPDVALRAFQRAAQADPKMPEIHLRLAEIYLGQGKKEEARKEVAQELTIVPESAAALELKKKLDSP